MYTGSARYYDVLYSFIDYGIASNKLHEIIERLRPDAASLLEVACGTGKFLEHLQRWYDVEGVDINPDALEIAKQRCPNVRLHHADMTEFSTGRSFDVVACLFSSIAYVRTVPRLQAAMAVMVRHVAPGGLLIVEPWFPPERFRTGHITTNFVDQPNLKIVRMYTSERVGDVGKLDMHYLVGDGHTIDHFTERHELGLFTAEQHQAAFAQLGLQARYDSEGLFGRGMYWAQL